MLCIGGIPCDAWRRDVVTTQHAHGCCDGFGAGPFASTAFSCSWNLLRLQKWPRLKYEIESPPGTSEASSSRAFAPPLRPRHRHARRRPSSRGMKLAGLSCSGAILFVETSGFHGVRFGKDSTQWQNAGGCDGAAGITKDASLFARGCNCYTQRLTKGVATAFHLCTSRQRLRGTLMCGQPMTV